MTKPWKCQNNSKIRSLCNLRVQLLCLAPNLPPNGFAPWILKIIGVASLKTASAQASIPPKRSVRGVSYKWGSSSTVSQLWVLTFIKAWNLKLWWISWIGGGLFCQPEFSTDLILYWTLFGFFPRVSEVEMSQRLLLVSKGRFARTGSGGLERRMALSMVSQKVFGQARVFWPSSFLQVVSLRLFLCCRPPSLSNLIVNGLLIVQGLKPRFCP